MYGVIGETFTDFACETSAVEKPSNSILTVRAIKKNLCCTKSYYFSTHIKLTELLVN